MDFDEWLQQGLSKGWCGPAVCYTHDGLPLTHKEEIEFESYDPCVNIIRLYEDPTQKTEVEENHSPSIWRATNSGLEL